MLAATLDVWYRVSRRAGYARYWIRFQFGPSFSIEKLFDVRPRMIMNIVARAA